MADLRTIIIDGIEVEADPRLTLIHHFCDKIEDSIKARRNGWVRSVAVE